MNVTLLAAPAVPSTIKLEAATNAANPLLPLTPYSFRLRPPPVAAITHWLRTYDGEANERLTRFSPFEASGDGKDAFVRRTTALFLLYLVIGVVVAYSDDYLENLDRIRRLLSAVLAVLLWPLVLLGFDVRVT